MALAVVQGPAHGGTSASAGSVAVTYGSTTASGNLLVALITRTTGHAVSSVTDSAGNSWVQAGTTLSNADNNDFDIWYAKNATANAGAVTATLASATTYLQMAIYEVSGADTSAPYDTSATGSGFGTAVASGTLTLATANEIIFAMVIATPPGVTQGTNYTGTNYTVTGDANAYFLAEYHIVTANEAATASASSGNWGILAAAFKAAGGTTFNQSALAISSPVATLTRSTGKPLAGSSSAVASLVRSTGKVLSGSSSPLGSLTRQAGKPLQASSSPVTSLSRQTAKTLAVNSSPLASLLKSTAKAFQASASVVATLTALRVRLLSLLASTSPVASISRAIGKPLQATTSPLATAPKQTTKTFAAITSPVSSLAKATVKTLRASVSVLASLAVLAGVSRIIDIPRPLGSKIAQSLKASKIAQFLKGEINR